MGLAEYHDEIVTWWNAGKTYREIYQEFEKKFGCPQKGFSWRSIRRYCKAAKINPAEFADIEEQHDINLVAPHLEMVGPSYGRRTFKGFLRSQGIYIGTKKIAQLQRLLAPKEVQLRKEQAEAAFNPEPYYAHSFGHKIHIDQNEKLVAFGVVHVVATDGYSRMALQAHTMAVKNNLAIYTGIWQLYHNTPCKRNLECEFLGDIPGGKCSCMACLYGKLFSPRQSKRRRRYIDG